MQKTYADLACLAERDPVAYRAEVERLRTVEPSRFEAFVDYLRVKLEHANAAEDRPLTPEEVDAAIARTATELGWSRSRVLAEAILRLRVSALLTPGYVPLTPPDNPGPHTYARRHSSIRALVLGQYVPRVRVPRAPAIPREEPTE